MKIGYFSTGYFSILYSRCVKCDIPMRTHIANDFDPLAWCRDSLKYLNEVNINALSIRDQMPSCACGVYLMIRFCAPRVACIGMYWIALGCIGLHWGVLALGCIGLHWGVLALGCIKVKVKVKVGVYLHWGVLDCIGVYYLRVSHTFHPTCGLRQHLSECISCKCEDATVSGT